MNSKRVAIFVLLALVTASVFAQENENLVEHARRAVTSNQTSDSGLLSGFSFSSIIGAFLFSGIGFVAFVYGKRNGEYRPMLIGFSLLAYPYFVQATLMVYLVGIGLTASLYWFRE